MDSNGRNCKFESAMESSKLAESGKSNQIRQFSRGVNQQGMRNSSDEMKRRRENQKVESLLQLICWGPNQKMGSNGRICKFESAFKAIQSSKLAESGKSNQIRRFSGGVNQQGMRNSSDEMKRRRENQKVETLLHLICWGPK
ncbi:hypothetical protein NE237_002513 [Protea cynaroides]|uniref:Uncharacterized protein n=1 Tax=Protea cynaroides TaxID=273540 RepID=A0A9Q0KV52_9MAGN|nr:hypothetical protein NE237_002513 [Protea cynaroides]